MFKECRPYVLCKLNRVGYRGRRNKRVIQQDINSKAIALSAAQVQFMHRGMLFNLHHFSEDFAL